MKKWVEMFTHFLKNKIYVIVLALTAACSYGFMITNYAIGIDDTPYAYYFEEGLSAIVGRWVMFLLNKVVNIAEFAPFLTDLVGVLIFMVAVTAWCVLFYSILGDRVPGYGYLFFACIFLSCPLISEVYVYYLHNGIAIGYLCSGISLYLFSEAVDSWFVKKNGKGGEKYAAEGCVTERLALGKRLILLAGVAVFLWIALGCYESFMMVWLMGVCLILMLKRICGKRDNVFAVIGIAGVVAVGGIILRSITISLVTAIFDLEYLKDDAVQRSITELVGWIFEEGAFSNFAMALKRTYVMYGVFACAYYPIFVFVLATIVIMIVALWMSIRKKDVWIFLLTIEAYVAAFSLIVIEGKVTFYRAAQFLPVICGLGALLFVYAVQGIVGVGISCLQKKLGKNGKSLKTEMVKIEKMAIVIKSVAIFLLSSVLWNQCADMNKWFYIDYMKYEAAKETMNAVALELEKGFDTTKPIVFTGIYEIPESIIQDAYVGYGTKEYSWMVRTTTWLDAHLLEKFYRDQGVIVAQMPSLSVIEWGRTAFDTDEELVKFFNMHGYSYLPLLDVEYEEAEKWAAGLASFPQEGSIKDAGEYIIVNF